MFIFQENEQIEKCEGCLKAIYEGEKHHRGSDVALCEECAPTFVDLISEPESFGDVNGDSIDPSAAKDIFDAHIASGGSPNDKMVAA